MVLLINLAILGIGIAGGPIGILIAIFVIIELNRSR